MLDGISPSGLEGPAGLNSLAGMFLGTAIVAVTIGAIIGVALWMGSKAGKVPNGAAKGLRVFVLAMVGAVVLSGAAGAIKFGSEIGTGELMPRAARQQDVVIDKKAPKSTCVEKAVRDFDKEDPKIPNDQRAALVRTLAGDVDLRSRGDWDGSGGDVAIESVKWQPSGPDCSADNQVAAACTEVEVRTGLQPNAVGGPSRDFKKFKVGGDCSAS